MSTIKCVRCHREIFFAKHPKTHHSAPFEKIEPYRMTVMSDGWHAEEVYPADMRPLYVAHQKYCVKKEHTKETPCPVPF